MANCDLSKVKILYLYDFFMTRLNPFDESSVSLAELLDILENETGYRFERKSVYSDIVKLNEFMRTSGKLRKGADEWIYMEKKRYKVNELSSQITIDEAKLLVDAVNTTAFVDSGISEKIKDLFPSYFSDPNSYAFLATRDHKPSAKLTGILNTCRTGIREWSVITITYGYKFGKAPAFKEKRNVSPLKLDWDNNTYYLIAVDNDIFDRNKNSDKPLESSIRRFRIDRIDSANYDGNDSYRGIKRFSDKAREGIVNNITKNVLNAYAAEDTMQVEIKITYTADKKERPDAIPKKEVLKAYSILSDHVKVEGIIKDSKLDEGEVIFVVSTADVPTFYAYLFQAGTVPGIMVSIATRSVREKYKEYLSDAMNAL